MERWWSEFIRCGNQEKSICTEITKIPINSQDLHLGNVKERKFSEIWTKNDNAIFNGLKNRLPLLKGRCAECKWLDVCGGSFRVRAVRVYDDPWAPDPACYLTDEEIGLVTDKVEAHA
jgi:radical SAM protein with 4Fe4S-binding SPASM domain